MSSLVGFKIYYFPPRSGSLLQKVLSYLSNAWRTFDLILKEKPEIVWFQVPPTFVTHIILLTRVLLRRRFRVVADCHNGALDRNGLGKFWTKVPGAISLLNHCDLVLVHNAEIERTAQREGVSPSKLAILEDRPSPLPDRNKIADDLRPVVLVPLSYSSDEPVHVVLNAARLLPEVTFKLTGSLRKAEAAGITKRPPPNVAFTGYLATEEYTTELLQCTAVLGLTSNEGVQLSAANEALGAGKALILSDTRVLRALFGDAAVFTENKAEFLVSAIEQAISRISELEEASRKLKAKREHHWQAQVEACLARL
jgi:glycosyltransferase involved in cell wall biosynthesis